MIQLHTLGGVDLRRDGTEVRSVLLQPKRLALLAYLCTARPRGFHARDALLALFWPEAEPARARNALRQALHYLRRSLGEEAVPGRGDREVGTDPLRLWCDAAEFDRALEEGRPEDALALYHGDFLPGLFVEDAPEAERWLDEERARRRREAMHAARALADRDEAAGSAAAAAGWARRAVDLAPHDEASLLRLVALLERTGAVAEAREAYDAFADAYRRDLGLEPSPEARAVAERLRRPPPAPAPAPAASPAAPPAPAPAGAHPVRAVRPPSRRGRGRAAVAAGVVLAAALAGGWALGRRSAGADAPRTADDRAPAPAVAVLPFLNLSGDDAHDYVSDGIADELVGLLGRVRGMRVVARTSSFAFRGRAVPVDSIGRALRVTHVVEGSVRMGEGRVRVTAQLVEAATGYHVWSETYDREAADVLAVQDEIAGAIREQLRVRLAPGAGPARAPHPDAHLALLKGAHLARRAATREEMERAAAFFRQAAERDPAYARPPAELAAVLLTQARRGFVPAAPAYARAEALALRARGLDPGLGAAHVALSRVAEARDRDFAAARAHVERALALEPHDAAALRRRTGLLLRLGHADRAEEAALRALEADPVSVDAHLDLAFARLAARRFDAARQAALAARDLDPGNGLPPVTLALAESHRGRHPEALAALADGLARLPRDPWALSYAVRVHARAGRRADAERAMAALDSLDGASPYLRAAARAALGERDRAFALLDEAVERGDGLAADLAMDLAFDGLRGDARMDPLLRRVGLRP